MASYYLNNYMSKLFKWIAVCGIGQNIVVLRTRTFGLLCSTQFSFWFLPSLSLFPSFNLPSIILLVWKISHFAAQLNESFLKFIFDCIERPHIHDEYDQIPYSLVSVVLSFNQHFKGR